MTSENMQLSDEHIVTVAGHGVDPSPVPLQSEDDEESLSSSDLRKVEKMHPRHQRRHVAVSVKSRSTLREIFLWYVMPVVVVILIRSFLIGAYTIPSGSMLETIHIGDQVLTSKLSPSIFSLRRGDIIVFEDPANWLSSEKKSGLFGGNNLIKRLIGLPGDTVECKGDGEPVTVNGVPIRESSYIRPGVTPSAFPFKIHVKQDHVFVLGDNRANSADSRYHRDDGDDGLVPISKVKGVAFMRYWPLTRISMLDDHHDAFDNVSPESSR